MPAETVANLQDRASRLRAALQAAFAPTSIEVVDDSARHAGHAGATPGGQTHYNVMLVSESFAGKGRVERSRMVHAALQSEFGSGLHALSLILRSPSEL